MGLAWLTVGMWSNTEVWGIPVVPTGRPKNMILSKIQNKTGIQNHCTQNFHLPTRLK